MTEAINQATEVKKTKAEIIQDKITKAEATLASLRAELDGLTKYDNLEVGGLVGFSFGRGDDKQNLIGEVQGVGTLENGVEVVVVLIGKGTLDVSIKRIPKSTLNAYTPPTKVAPIDLVAETQAAQAEADPLADTVSSDADALLAGA